ncbi:mitochondrial import inner membrane translocase subunit tim54 [Apophysomyces ossiformis]|uniref:Mitochondrial import inner membrane translocase subunit TIM54 n=1 Tax=Apophysomyces ossiformis TaxID=679940 RepID=A0A8H7EMQ8_9FUNG|nr:mitochondrial import inner membrane translocase subunit tim54 [Apophysomyces ossiformis]
MRLPFGLKPPSRGTVIFAGVAATVSGTIYASNHYATQSRQKLYNKVSWLAEKPCGVHEMPRKVLIYITAPPGDGLEKSRNWFREYIKPILVAGAVDYEVKEGSQPGQIEAAVREEIARRRREQAAKDKEQQQQQLGETQIEDGRQNPFAPMVSDVLKKKKQQEYDGVMAIGRNAWREVLSGLSKGCEASLVEEKKPAEGQKQEAIVSETTSKEDEPQQHEQSMIDEEQTVTETEPIVSEPVVAEKEEDTALLIDEDQTATNEFSLPPSFSPIMYIPHHNIIGWTNIPYRLYMWIADYKRVEEIGRYAVAVVLNQTRPLEVKDADVGLSEKVYWIGEDAEEAVKNDTPIVIDERIRPNLRTYISEDLAHRQEE